MKNTAPNNGISINDTAALEAFYSSVIKKPTFAMARVDRLVREAEKAEERLASTGFPESEFVGATLYFRKAKWTGKSDQFRNANFLFRRDADGWKLIGMEKCMSSSEIWDRNKITTQNPEVQEKLGGWNF